MLCALRLLGLIFHITFCLITIMSVKISIIKEGYSIVEPDYSMRANGTCTLIQDQAFKILVDTLTAWDRDFLIDALKKQEIKCEDVTHVVCTHGHSDHVGNLNLFTKAKHIVGQSISFEDKYEPFHFEEDKPYVISNNISVVMTPGHTGSDVSVVVKNTDYGTVVVSGDLFEKKEDIENPYLWQIVAVSENQELQYKHRKDVLSFANYVIPGHGPMFKVTEELIALHNKLM